MNDVLVNNLKPETHLFLFTDSSISQQKSKLKVHWWGDDKDGLVIGFLIKWEGIDNNWTFTTSNDSTFALPIGTVDTSFTFLVSAIDNSGDGIFGNIIFNDVNISNEPFTDKNGNGKYDDGEPFIDIGAIDETPAKQKFPIKNSAPEISWNKATILPNETFPAITVGWDAFDLDGNETISEIHIALNDTNNYLTINGSTRIVSLILNNNNKENSSFKLFINGDASKEHSENLRNLLLDNYNRLFIRAVDNSGASSKFIPLPDTGRNWFVKKPKGELLIIDNYLGGQQVQSFYDNIFNEILTDKFDVFDIETNKLPYESITFLNTIKLFKYVFWYSDSKPSLDLTNLVTQNFLQSGGKLAFSLTFQDSSENFNFSLPILQTFLPLEALDTKKPLTFLFPGANIISSTNFENFPNLKTESTIAFIRTFQVSQISASKVYDLTSNQLNGEIALLNNTKNLFFIGIPLHQANANGNVKDLIEEIFIKQFGLKQ